MISYLFEFFLLAFLFFILVQSFKFTLYLLYLWQIVEYRFDRIKIRLCNPGDFKEFLSYFNFFNFKQFNKYPKITLRTTITISVLFFICYQLFFFLYRHLIKLSFLKNEFILTLLIVIAVVYCLIPFLVTFITLIISTLFLPLKKFLIFLARKKIRRYKNLLVIGITGSYGKSSTKEIIAAILALKFKVLKTPVNVNTEIGVAKTILLSLKKQHQIFVVEMGAYKQGEISAICDLVEPQIGVLTGINEQHLALFGSLIKTLKAKGELIKALPLGGLALFNIKDPYCRKLSRKLKKVKVYLYGKKAESYYEALSAGCYLGEHFAVSQTKIKKIIPKLKKTLELKKGKNSSRVLVFDDSYSANPNGFEKALDQIKQYKRKKLVVTPGIIELGKSSPTIHRKIGRQLAVIADRIIITSDNFKKEIQSGAGPDFKWKFLVSQERKVILDWLGGSPNRNWIVLIEGRVPLNIKNIFIEKNK